MDHCYGYSGSDVYPGLKITQNEATSLLLHDIGTAAGCVNRLVTVLLVQEEFDALVDFVFNLGTQAFAGSALLGKVNAGDFHGAIGRVRQVGPRRRKVVAGLLRRRTAEAQLFKQGVEKNI